MPSEPRSSSVAGILREIETNTAVPRLIAGSPACPAEPVEDPAVKELRQQLRAARHENSALKASLFRSNERLSRLSSEVWRFDTERTQQLKLLRLASADLRGLVSTLGLPDKGAGASTAETAAEQALGELQAAASTLRGAAAEGLLLSRLGTDQQREELSAERERLQRAAQAIQLTQLSAARARELRRRRETCDATCSPARDERRLREQATQCEPPDLRRRATQTEGWAPRRETRETQTLLPSTQCVQTHRHTYIESVSTRQIPWEWKFREEGSGDWVEIGWRFREDGRRAPSQLGQRMEWRARESRASLRVTACSCSACAPCVRVHAPCMRRPYAPCPPFPWWQPQAPARELAAHAPLPA